MKCAGLFLLGAYLLCIAAAGKLRDRGDADATAVAVAAASGDESAADAIAASSDDESAASAATAASGDESAAVAVASDGESAEAATTAASSDESDATAETAEADAEADSTADDGTNETDSPAESHNETITIGIDPETRVICICKLNFVPVCGSDGVTYSNECVLNCVSDDHVANDRPPIHSLYQGKCRTSSCKCSEVWDPVCGTNNQTYTNDCYFACKNAQLVEGGLSPIIPAYRGVCKKESCTCPNTITPVCGTDGKTYRNICFLQYYSRIEQAQGRPAIYPRSTGACLTEPCNCPLITKQLCASDGNTYYNQCALDCQNRRRKQLGQDPLTVKYPGECNNCICPLYLNQVCASDGYTYSNDCFLLCENQKRRRAGLPDLVVRWRGSCTCGCTKEWQPVCARNQKTFANRCLLDCENKKRLLNGLPSLTVLYNGECSQCNCCHCPIKYAPVCGSDQKTYGNICYLKCNSDCRIASGLTPIWRIANRKCW